MIPSGNLKKRSWLLFGLPHHEHARQTALALYEQGMLSSWVTGLVFHQNDWIWRCFGSLKSRLQRRMISEIPSTYLKKIRHMEGIRLLSSRLFRSKILVDWLWERGEWMMDDHVAWTLNRKECDVIGFEHGCLFSMAAAKNLGRRSYVIFTSPHHHFYETWMRPELRIHRNWISVDDIELLNRAITRDQRRDHELSLADGVIANSDLTARTLIQSGGSSQRIRSVPLGLHSAGNVVERRTSTRFRFIYSGPISIRKGYPYLQKALQMMKGKEWQMDVYGGCLVPQHVLWNHPQVTYHGNVSKQELDEAYACADVLVFPTLCDGSGQVVGEALNAGLPVICSENAGAVQWIRHRENGFIVPAADADQLKLCMEYCLDHRDLLQMMKYRALETARSWSWTRYREALIQCLMRES